MRSEPDGQAAARPALSTSGSDADVPVGLEAAANGDEDNPHWHISVYCRLKFSCLEAIA
jgi:hypothetical protein